MLTTHEGAELFHERIDGPDHRPMLVFLHEGLGSAASWKTFPLRLCEAAACPGLLYDREGFGLSSPARKPRTLRYLHESAEEELPQVLRQVIGEEQAIGKEQAVGEEQTIGAEQAIGAEQTIRKRPYILIGHSDGGSIALLHAAEFSPLAVIVEAAHVFVESETVRGVEAAVRAYESGRLAGLARYHGEKTDAVFHAWADTWLAPWFRSWDIRDVLPAIRCPVLALQGREDPYATAAQVEAIVAGNPLRRGVFLDGCGHNPHGEHPARVCDLMEKFIREVGGR